MEVTAAIGTTLFADRLASAVERKRSQLLAGLDPRPSSSRSSFGARRSLGTEQAAAACTRFCCGVIDAVAPYVVGVKPQIAFFEALGAHGVKSFEDVCAYAHAAELIVLVDAKRGDIGSTARAYASAYLEPRDGDAASATRSPVPRISAASRSSPSSRARAATAPGSSACSRPRTPAVTCRT